MPIVVNILGMQDVKCSCCKSWLEHWKKHSGSDPGLCRSCGKAEASVGGYVQKTINHKGNRYIVPLCKACSDGKEKLNSFIVAQWDLVSVGACFQDLSDIDDTCDADIEFSDN